MVYCCYHNFHNFGAMALEECACARVYQTYRYNNITLERLT